MKPSRSYKPGRAARRPPATPHHQPETASRYAVDYMDHAPVWQGPIFALGLFRPTQNGAPATPLKVQFDSKVRDLSMRYVLRSPQALNVMDQAVYFYLCQRIASGDAVPLPPEHERYPAYREAMSAVGLGDTYTMAVVKVTPSEIATGVGLTHTGTNARAMLASLTKLSQVTMERQQLNDQGWVIEQGSSRFLAFLCFDTELRIVLNVESSVLVRERKGVAWVNMREHRSLKSKPAKRLHAWLTAWASAGSRKLVGLDRLLLAVWGEVPATSDIRKDRKRTLRKAIAEITQLPGWSCVYTEKENQLLVTRPAFVGTRAQQGKQPIKASASARPPAATPTKAAGTPTQVAATATHVAVTPTAVPLQSAPSTESDELVFAL